MNRFEQPAEFMIVLQNQDSDAPFAKYITLATSVFNVPGPWTGTP